MGEYEEIVELQLATGVQFRRRKISVRNVKAGIRVKLPKEYSTYAISK